MSTRFGTWSIRICAIGLTLFGVASAQTGDAPVELEGTEEVKPPPSRAAAAAIVSSIQSALEQVKGMLTEAKDESDVVKVLCLQDKTDQITSASEAAAGHLNRLVANLSIGAMELAVHELTLLQVLGDRVNTLVSEANQCVGEETGFTGDTEVQIEVDPNLPSSDPNTIPLAPVVVVPPSVNSPVD